MAHNQRQAPRVRKRARVEFGKDDLSMSGFTQDISIGGMLVTSQSVLPVGTRVHLHVILPDDHFYGAGLVVRHRPVPRELRTIERPGMGIRFLAPQELVDALVPTPLRARGSLGVDCKGAAAHAEVMAQLDSGHLLLPDVEAPPPLNAIVEFEVRGPASSCRGRGRVVQLLEQDAGRSSVVLELQDVAQLRHAVRGLAPGG